MKEPLNYDNLTTADIVNPSQPVTGARESDLAEDHVALTSDHFEVTPYPGSVSASSQPAEHDPLFPQIELQSLRSRWSEVQTSFVDEPRTAVEQADRLVANVVKRIAEQFASEREQLELQWDRGGNANTEDLRQALRRYRAFFDRLLAF